MSSDSSEGKPDAEEAGPASARAQARIAASWGAARNALAAVHNLAALLRSSHVSDRTILDLLSELRSSAVALREAFSRSRADDAAAAASGAYGAARVEELDALLDAIGAATGLRQEFASRAGALADALEGCIDLLALLDRAAAPLATEVRLHLLAREAGRMSSGARGPELLVRFDESSPECVVVTDPSIVGQLVSLLVASVHGHARDAPLVLRALSTPTARLLVETCGPNDASLSTVAIRVAPWLPPSEAAVRLVVARLGATLDVGHTRASLVLGLARD